MAINKQSIKLYTPTSQDACVVFDILKLAMIELLDDLFGYDHLNTFKFFFNDNQTRFSKQNICCAKVDENIVAAMCSYGGKDALMLDDKMNQYLKQYNKQLKCECLQDEYYLDSIAVQENYRGNGIFKVLMHQCFDLAKANGYKKISLLAKNPKIYTAFGFEIVEEFELYNEKYFKMIKLI